MLNVSFTSSAAAAGSSGLFIVARPTVSCTLRFDLTAFEIVSMADTLPLMNVPTTASSKKSFLTSSKMSIVGSISERPTFFTQLTIPPWTPSSRPPIAVDIAVRIVSEPSPRLPAMKLDMASSPNVLDASSV